MPRDFPNSLQNKNMPQEPETVDAERFRTGLYEALIRDLERLFSGHWSKALGNRMMGRLQL